MDALGLGAQWTAMRVKSSVPLPWGAARGGRKLDAMGRRAAVLAAILLSAGALFVLHAAFQPDPTPLRAELAAAADAAAEHGALRPLALQSHRAVAEHGVLYVVSRAAPRESVGKPAPGAGGDAFAEPQPWLEVQPSEPFPEHRLVLNKFATLPQHALLVSRDFVPQAQPLSAADWAAWWRAVLELDALGFFNSALEAGASQPRRHLQLVPLDVLPDALGLPEPAPPAAAAVVAAAPRRPWTPFRVPGLPVEHTCWRVDARAPDAAERLRVAVKQPAGPHNIVLTTRWAMVVPRSAGSFGGVDVNGLGFAGLLLARSSEADKFVRERGPAAVLAGVGVAP